MLEKKKVFPKNIIDNTQCNVYLGQLTTITSQTGSFNANTRRTNNYDRGKGVKLITVILNSLRNVKMIMSVYNYQKL